MFAISCLSPEPLEMQNSSRCCLGCLPTGNLRPLIPAPSKSPCPAPALAPKYIEFLEQEQEQVKEIFLAVGRTSAVVLLIAGFLFALFSPQLAMAETEVGSLTDRSYSLAELPAPPLYQGIGTSSFSITTSSPRAQQYFNQGLNQLHAFEDFESYRAFAAASKLDPKAPMPYWGMYIATRLRDNPHYHKKGPEQLKKAFVLRSSATRLEQRIVEATQELEQDPPHTRLDRFFDEMNQLSKKFPKEKELKFLLALFHLAGEGGHHTTRASRNRAREILQPLVQANPSDATAHHYWVHALEPSADFSAATDSAELLPQLAPHAPHLLHMPGHIQFLSGNYLEARESFLASREADLAYLRAQEIHPLDNWNYLHNLEFLVRIEAELGNYSTAQKFADELSWIDEPATLPQGEHYWSFLYHSAITRFKLDWTFSRWDRAEESAEKLLAIHGSKSPALSAFYRGLKAFAAAQEALAKTEKDNAQKDRAEEELNALYQVYWKLKDLSDDERERAYVNASRKFLAILIDELRGITAVMSKDSSEARSWFAAAKQKEAAMGYHEPPAYPRALEEAAARAYLAIGNKTEAKGYAQEALDRFPKSVRLIRLREEILTVKPLLSDGEQLRHLEAR